MFSRFPMAWEFPGSSSSTMGFPTTWARLEVARFCTWWDHSRNWTVETVEDLHSDTSYRSVWYPEKEVPGIYIYIYRYIQNSWDKISTRNVVDKMFRYEIQPWVTWGPKSVRVCESADVFGYLCMCARSMWSHKDNSTVRKDCGIGNQHGQT